MTSTVSPQMDDSTEFNVQNSQKRFSLGVESDSSTTSYPSSRSRRSRSSSPDSRTSEEECRIRSNTSTVLHLPYIQDTKSIRGKQTDNRLVKTQLVHQNSTFQNDKPSDPGKANICTSMGSKDRLTRCLLTHTNERQSTQVSSIRTQQETLLFQSITIRAKCSTSPIYIGAKTPTEPLAPTGHLSNSLFRRLDNLGSFSQSDISSRPNNCRY